MTAFPHLRTNPKDLRSIGIGQILFGAFGVFCLLLLLKNSELAILYMNRGLLLCAKTIVPSLFPFLVLSELLISGGVATHLPKRMIKPLEKLFDLPADGCIAVLLGLFCGFPVGAKCTVLAYRKGALTKEEAERALCFSNNPSSAFLISAVGTSLFGNRKLGMAIYLTSLLCSVLCGVTLSFLRRRKVKKEKKEYSRTNTPHISYATAQASPLKGATLFTSSVRSATESMLLVCAYVVFFSTLVGTLQLILGQFSLPAEFLAFFFCFFEISSGASVAAALSNSFCAAMLCAFAAGWSGLSVHCQILSVCDGCGLSFRRYSLTKLAQGLLCALLIGLLLSLFPSLLIPQESPISAFLK